MAGSGWCSSTLSAPVSIIHSIFLFKQNGEIISDISKKRAITLQRAAILYLSRTHCIQAAMPSSSRVKTTNENTYPCEPPVRAQDCSGSVSRDHGGPWAPSRTFATREHRLVTSIRRPTTGCTPRIWKPVPTRAIGSAEGVKG